MGGRLTRHLLRRLRPGPRCPYGGALTLNDNESPTPTCGTSYDCWTRKGLVHHVTAEVDPVLELGAITARSLERQGPAIIFDNVKGYPDKPMVVNLLSTIEQVALAFGTEPDEAKIHERVVSGMDHRLPSVEVDSGPCKEVIVSGDDIDLDFIPTPLWHEHDGGQYLATTAGVVTRDPVTGILNIGLYRAMIKDKQTLSLSGGIRGRESSTGPGGGDHILSNEAEGRPTPIAIVMGTDPLVTLSAGSPVRPNSGELEGSMEYEAAGGWRGEATKLVQCETSDLLVPRIPRWSSRARCCRTSAPRRGRTASRPASTARTRRRSSSR